MMNLPRAHRMLPVLAISGPPLLYRVQTGTSTGDRPRDQSASSYPGLSQPAGGGAS